MGLDGVNFPWSSNNDRLPEPGHQTTAQGLKLYFLSSLQVPVQDTDSPRLTI